MIRLTSNSAMRIAFALGTLAAAVPLAAQSIESRVTSAPDGVVRLSFSTRPGVCGDAKNIVATGHVLYIWPSLESTGRWSAPECVPGPASVEINVRGSEVNMARVRIGGGWNETDERVTDLGTVSAPEAAQAMLAFASRTESSRAVRELLLAAAIAEGANVAPGFLQLARDGSRSLETRRRSVFWYGVTGGRDAVPTLAQMAQDDKSDRSMREAAIGALAEMPDDAGVSILIDIATRGSDYTLRGKAAFWLGQAEDLRARRTLRSMIESEETPEMVKQEAIFALSQGEASSDDARFLQNVYKRFTSEALKDRVFFALSQMKDDRVSRWLLEVGRDERETVRSRNQALFWAGQSGAALTDLARTYDAISEPKVKDHLIFVLSQRDETEAVDKLIAIAKSDPDRAMRKKAIFWLGQKDDPSAVRTLTDMISH